ncbi:hypothetical protein ABZ419_21000 [Streptomyces cinnamoneus]|uniref:hypothetical protein n=1 Tax=Streptomyces cinnamoneus TaxID=53446 RepID=UPI0033F03D36
MNDVLESLRWDGSTAMVSLFLVTEASTPPDLDCNIDQFTPDDVRVYALEDEGGILEGFNVFEWDLVFERLPADAFSYLEELLRRSCAKARLAWLGFEGSFHFDFLLAGSVANQIYGVCSIGEAPVVKLDEHELNSAAWRETLSRHRMALRLPQ